MAKRKTPAASYLHADAKRTNRCLPSSGGMKRVVVSDDAWYPMMRGALEDGHVKEVLYRLVGFSEPSYAYAGNASVVQSARRGKRSVDYTNTRIRNRLDCYDRAVFEANGGMSYTLIGEGHIHPEERPCLSVDDRVSILTRMQELGMKEWFEIVFGCWLKAAGHSSNSPNGEYFVRYPKRVGYCAWMKHDRTKEILEVVGAAFHIDSELNVCEVPLILEGAHEYIKPFGFPEIGWGRRRSG